VSRDTVTISAIGRASRRITIDRCTQYELTRDLTGPSEARFEFGDDDSWADLEDAIATGTRYQVQVNGVPWVTGRTLTRALPVSASGGSTIQLTVRSRLADAMFASCDPKVRVAKDTLKALIVDAYASIGLTAADIVFIDVTDRELAAGTGVNGDKDPEARQKFRVMFPDDARVHPPETVHQYTERHLNRFGLTQWDLPDGRIAIGAPDDLQAPSYRFRCHRGAGRNGGNNIINATRMEDYEGVPEELTLCGYGAIAYSASTAYKFTVTDQRQYALEERLRRRVLVLDPAINRDAMGEMRARKEMAQRSRQKDAYQIEVDGWTNNNNVLDVNKVADIQIDTAKVPGGAHLIWRVELSGNAQQGHTARVATVARGIWRLS